MNMTINVNVVLYFLAFSFFEQVKEETQDLEHKKLEESYVIVPSDNPETTCSICTDKLISKWSQNGA